MWAMLTDVSKQIEWPVNGRIGPLTKEEWKDVLTAALTGEQRMAEGVNGGFVFLGQRTRNMGVKKMSDMIEVVYMFGSERNVQWSEPLPPEYIEQMKRTA